MTNILTRANIITKEQAEHALTDTALKVLAWKPGPTLGVAVAVVRHAREVCDDHFNHFWPDAVDLGFVAESDTATIGIAYKLLIKAGLVEKTGKFRRSTVKESKGRTIFEYRLTHYGLADTFLKRHGAQPNPAQQQDMFA